MPRKATLFALLACFCAAASAHGPSRQKVVETVTINAPAAKVWGMVADFCSIKDWHPGVVECVGDGGNAEGATRVLTVGEVGGPQIHEELLKYDAEGMTYKYKITETVMEVLPVTTYSAFFTVKDNGDGTSIVEWKGGFYRGHPNNDPPPEMSDEAAVKAVTATYQGGLAELKKRAEQ
ncbi:MAG: SRPBCC family protein [Gammaproteobacteria bacterium]